MRKIYSIVLTACALLLSTSLFAAKTVTTAAELQQAIKDGETNIVIGNDITVDATPITVFADPTQKITIDLNGKLVSTTTQDYVFWILKGNVEFEGAAGSEIRNANSVKEKKAIQIEGQGNPDVADYSVLTIGKDVLVQATCPEGKAIVIDGTIKDDYYPYASEDDLDNMTIGTYTDDGGVVKNVILDRKNQTIGQLYTVSKGKYTAANTPKTDENNKLYGANRFATYQAPTTKTLYTQDGSGYTEVTDTYYKISSPTFALAYGVKVTINGTVYGQEYGIKINGNVGKLEGVSEDNIPTVIISKDANVYANPADTKSTGVYSSGYGKFEISGFVHGATGIYIKSGKVDLKDAIVKSDYTDKYTEPAGKRSGVDAGGSAIVIESNASYRGGQELKIEGDTKVEGGSGYAIEEAITTAVDTKVSSIVVEGGTIIAGGEGTAVVTAKTVDENVVEIVGGNIEDGGFFVKNDEGNNVPASPDNFVPSTGYIITTIQDENGRTITVVTEGTTPQGEESVANAKTASVNWIGTEETLDDNINLDYLEINNKELQVLTVNENVTLTVGRVVMGTKAKIIVKAGARLIVDGEQGIVAPVTSNLVLETSETTPAQFLFNPGVNSNRHPNATVSLIANSYTSATEPKVDYLYQRFGVPTYNAVKNVTAKKAGADVQVSFRIYENNGWTYLGYLNVAGQSLRKDRLNTPFGYYTLQCNTPEVGTVVNFEGELMGNDNATLATGANTNGWSTFANSYSANLNMESMLSMFDGLPEGSNAAIYFQKNQAGTDNMFDWNIIDQTKLLVLNSSQIQALINLNPMQSFLIKDPASDITMSLNYKTMVWEPATGTASGAPRRAMSNLTKAAINLSYDNAAHDAVYMIQGDEFSAEIESGYDSEKYMSGKANIYVMNDKKYATCATNDLENTYIGFSCAEAGNYTISFENIAGEGLALVDMVANKVIDMTEGAEYEFYAQESNDYRFKVVGRNNVSTAVENVENAATKAAGVYTLTGMYLGNMSVWNTLPAGVYVVDGEKRVK